MAIWVGLGALVAVAIVVAAVLFRPGDGPETADVTAEDAGASSVPVAPAVSAGQPAGQPAPAGGDRPPVAAPALATVQTVRLRIGPEITDARRDRLVAALTEAGLPNVVVEQLPFRIATSRIGYYRDEDLAAAQALAQVISPAVGEGAPIGVRDYGELLSDPQPGRLDLWIGG